MEEENHFVLYFFPAMPYNEVVSKKVAHKAVKGSSGRLGRSTWRQYDVPHPPIHLNRQTFIMMKLGIIIKVFFRAMQDARSSRGRWP